MDTTAQVLTRRTRAVTSVVAALVVCVGAVVPACSSSSAHPKELGGCVATAGVPCSPPPAAGGGSSPQGDGGSGGVSDSSSFPLGEGGSCGAADTSLLNSTQACTTCIVAGTGSAAGLDCCAADTACATDCVQIVSCVQSNCQVGDGTCVSTCELASPTGVQAYNDFAQCLRGNCSPQCPTLTLGTAGDI